MNLVGVQTGAVWGDWFSPGVCVVMKRWVGITAIFVWPVLCILGGVMRLFGLSDY